ncbi:MAG: hypothetical protein HY720_33310 [Planctomycetes bacterium]|nr:hypothetical protein [Planctomycetota bacterium]
MRASRELEEAQARTEKRLDELADGQREMQLGHAEFERDMREAVARLCDGQSRLQEGQIALQKSVRELAQAQARTEARVDDLAQAQKRTEDSVQRLAEAMRLGFARSEARMDGIDQRIGGLERTMRTEIGKLTNLFGQSIEEIAMEVVPFYLAREEGIELVSELRRDFFKVDGQEFEIDLAGEGRRGEEKFLVLCEAKNSIDIREVEDFKGTVAKIAASTGEHVHAVMFSSRCARRAEPKARELGIVLIPWEYRLES